MHCSYRLLRGQSAGRQSGGQSTEEARVRASQMKGTGPRYTPSRLLLLSSHVVVSGVPRYKERLEEKAKGLMLLRIPVEWQGK